MPGTSFSAKAAAGEKAFCGENHRACAMPGGLVFLPTMLVVVPNEATKGREVSLFVLRSDLMMPGLSGAVRAHATWSDA